MKTTIAIIAFATLAISCNADNRPNGPMLGVSGAVMPDGTVHVRGRIVYIDGVKYVKNGRYMTKYSDAVRHLKTNCGEFSLMRDLKEREAVDRYTLANTPQKATEEPRKKGFWRKVAEILLLQW